MYTNSARRMAPIFRIHKPVKWSEYSDVVLPRINRVWRQERLFGPGQWGIPYISRLMVVQNGLERLVHASTRQLDFHGTLINEFGRLDRVCCYCWLRSTVRWLFRFQWGTIQSPLQNNVTSLPPHGYLLAVTGSRSRGHSRCSAQWGAHARSSRPGTHWED